MIAERFTNKMKEIKYPVEDKKRISEIEDMAGKANREAELKKYKEELQIAKTLYREKEANIVHEFKLALFDAYGVKNNPKAEKVFSMAWDRGHSTGFNDIEIEFSDLVELIK